MDTPDVKSARILVVDDIPANVLVLESLLEAADFTSVSSTTDPGQVVDLCAELEPDLLILDLHMPEIDGYEVMGMLSPWIRGSSRLPILVVTADVSNEARRKALSLGARDFLTKPLDPSEVLARVTNLIESRLLQRALRERNQALEAQARQSTRELEEARLDVLERLGLAAEYRDDETYEHTLRIGRAAELIGQAAGLDRDTLGLLRRAAPLHDLGKLAISDSILLKPARLSPEEFEIMKTHVTIGGEILARGRSALLRMSEEIARGHHERWDGGGYPMGLSGEDIPMSCRIVALADTFDALTHDRPYSQAQEIPEAVGEIRRLAGEHFDPHLVDAFLELDHEALNAPLGLA